MWNINVFGLVLLAIMTCSDVHAVNIGAILRGDNNSGIDRSVVDDTAENLKIDLYEVIKETPTEGNEVSKDASRLKISHDDVETQEDIANLVAGLMNLNEIRQRSRRSNGTDTGRGDLGYVSVEPNDDRGDIGGPTSTTTESTSIGPTEGDVGIVDIFNTTDDSNITCNDGDEIEIQRGSICCTCDQIRRIIIPGPPGEAGERGPPGENGQEGKDGRQGPLGTPGTRGQVGAKGDLGMTGMDGAKGEPGIHGRRGLQGTRGFRGEKGDSGSGSTGGGTVYTRWGKDDCPSTSRLVYSGLASGSQYNQQGGGTGYLCLPNNPIFYHPSRGQQQERAEIRSAEYRVSHFPPFYGKDKGDVPCAVCRVIERSVIITQPARNVCPPNWTCEYYGYLMTSSSRSYRTEWICVDYDAEITSWQSRSKIEGAILVPVESACGESDDTGLPCSSYPNGYELTCAVCTI